MSQQDDILIQGLELMLFGVGAVVLFLSLLVLVTSLTSRLMSRYFPERLASPVPVSAEGSASLPAAHPGQTALVAVIAAAIAQHRKQRQ